MLKTHISHVNLRISVMLTYAYQLTRVGQRQNLVVLRAGPAASFQRASMLPRGLPKVARYVKSCQVCQLSKVASYFNFCRWWMSEKLPGFISQKVFVNSFLKSQSPHKFVNLSFIITNIKNKLTDLCGN